MTARRDNQGKAQALAGHGVTVCTECRGSLADVKGSMARRRQQVPWLQPLCVSVVPHVCFTDGCGLVLFDVGLQIVLFGCGDAFHRACLPPVFSGCPRCNQNEAMPGEGIATPSPAGRRRGSNRRKTSFALSVRVIGTVSRTMCRGWLVCVPSSRLCSTFSRPAPHATAWFAA